MTIRSYALLSIVCTAGVLFFASGCDKRAKALESARAEANTWRGKYEVLVEQNERVYKELEGLKGQNATLGQQVEALSKQLKEKQEEAAAKASTELAELKQLVEQRDQTIEKLVEEAKHLRSELGAASGEGSEEALLSKRVKVRSELEEIGKLMLDEGRLEVARSMFTNAVELGTDDPSILFLLAYCCGEVGDDNAAAEWYSRVVTAVEREPEKYAALLPKLYSNYGATLVKLGEMDEALKWYEKSLQADENYPAVYFNLGCLYAEHLNKPDEAIEAYRRHVILAGSRSIAARNAILKLQQKQAEEKKEEAPPAMPEG